MPTRYQFLAAACVLAGAAAGAGCAGTDPPGVQTTAGGVTSIKVVATTTQLGDFVREVGGPSVRVTQILRPNTDPHEYEPRPNDVKDTAGAAVVFKSGDNLDKWMDDVVKQSGGSPTVVDLSGALPVKRPGQSSGPEASKYDPHWWHDPRDAESAVRQIQAALINANPKAEATITAGAHAYLAELDTLDAGIAACFDKTVPPADRKLVTDHDAFGYFAARYGIRVIGAVIPSQTTEAQPSASALSKLAAIIRSEHVKAVFPESSVNAKLARAIAEQTGATADHTLYGDTLGPAGSAGATYLGMEQANADAMIKGFTGGADGCAIPGL